MSYHVGVLPADLLQTLSEHLEGVEDGEPHAQEDNGLPFVRLPHPRTGVPSLFLPYQLPQHGKSTILEVQAVSPPNPRSWFLSEKVIEDGQLLVMTPIDPALLLIPLLRTTQPADGLGSFRPAEDIIEEVANKLTVNQSKESDAIINLTDVHHLSSLDCIQAAMRHICEYKEITPEIVVFRYSSERVQTYLRAKVARLSIQDISDISRTLTHNLARDGLLEDGRETLLTLGRLRHACELVSQYLPRDLYQQLVSSYNFEPLDVHMKILKEEAMALAGVNMNAVEATESRDGKETKDTSSDKKRKAKGSAGVEKLKKVNVKGMSKLSTFFQKK